MIERKQYTSEFKRDAVRLLESGLGLTQASQQLGVNSGLMRKWKRQLQRETPYLQHDYSGRNLQRLF